MRQIPMEVITVFLDSWTDRVYFIGKTSGGDLYKVFTSKAAGSILDYGDMVDVPESIIGTSLCERISKFEYEKIYRECVKNRNR